MEGGEEGGAEVGCGEGEEGKDEPPEGGAAEVEGDGVEEEGDEGGGFFGVPAPVAAPGFVGPDGAGDDSEAEEVDGGVEQGEGAAAHALGVAEKSAQGHGGDDDE